MGYFCLPKVLADVFIWAQIIEILLAIVMLYYLVRRDEERDREDDE